MSNENNVEGLSVAPETDAGPSATVHNAPPHEVGSMVVFAPNAWIYGPEECGYLDPVTAKNPRAVISGPDRQGHYKVEGSDLDYPTGIYVAVNEIVPAKATQP